MNKKEIHAYLDEVLDEAYARGNRDGYQQGRSEGYRFGRSSVILPHPCDGPLYDDWTPEDHLAKVAEEYDEVLKAFASFRESGKLVDRFNLFNECTDLQVAIVSMMDRLGCHEAGRQRCMYEVNESNAQRDHGQRFKKEG